MGQLNYELSKLVSERNLAQATIERWQQEKAKLEREIKKIEPKAREERARELAALYELQAVNEQV